jgi:hypothetical protein
VLEKWAKTCFDARGCVSDSIQLGWYLMCKMHHLVYCQESEYLLGTPELALCFKANLANGPQECVCFTLWVLQDLLAATSGRLAKPDYQIHSLGQSAYPEPCRDDTKLEHLSDYLAIVTCILNRHYNSRL